MTSAWFLSDLHLKTMQERSSQKLLRFFNSLLSQERPATHLYLVGDIFDVWIGDHSFFENRFAPLIEAIVRCQKSGIRVVYFEGNHDVHVQRYWSRRYGIDCFIDAKYEKIGPHVVRIEHGDLINQQDQKYLKYRDFIRQPFMQQVAHFLPGKIFQALGERASQQSRQKSSVMRRESEEELRQMIRDHAVKVLTVEPFDFCVTGHMHIRDDWNFSVGSKPARSINLGSWFDRSQVFHLTDTHAEWVTVE